MSELTKAQPLYLRQLPLGPMKNFVYLLGSPGGKEAVVIDPAWDVEAIRVQLEADDRKLAAIVLTHHHHDHINMTPRLLEQFDVPVYAQRAEVEHAEALRPFVGAIKLATPGMDVEVAGITLKLVHTPGHTPGSQCVLCAGALISGDTVFVNACGRCDLPGGNPTQMWNSLSNVLGALPDDTVLWPGHDYGDVKVSSLQREREQNPYFRFKTMKDFVAYRMPRLTAAARSGEAPCE
jgi:glyoxylase-like metal-dependent hydrolase (beta-lactamase superfamily II)